ncbi:MAG: hypothetical protein FWE71_02775 [Nocardioidaceae bacterium]|nr:hypothetical protein [Nocardioidaceae bacterium]MCL2613768.1 hypothetical protein [Nocardioidaceae bacterium]
MAQDEKKRADEADPDVTSDPNLDDPTDPADDEDEGTSSDWASEGGATEGGPATSTEADDR